MTPVPLFTDRYDAGQRLGTLLLGRSLIRPMIVLGLPRGGVPVAACIAEVLDAPLDVFVVRKLGVPDHEELAFGAIASGGAQVLNGEVIDHFGIDPKAIERVIAGERLEIERRLAEFRGGRRLPAMAGETVIVVDDGAATGASMRVAIDALRQLSPRTIIAAIPLASRDALGMLRTVADDVVCLATPDPFHGVGLWYADFAQTSDAEVRLLLADARRRWETSGPLRASA